MLVYKFGTTITTAGGNGSANTNNIVGGLCHQLYIVAQTSTTVFRATITDEDSDVVRSYDWHRGEIQDDTVPLVVKGVYTVAIVNASADGPFRVVMVVRE